MHRVSVLAALLCAASVLAACDGPTPSTPTTDSPAASRTPAETQLQRQTRLDFEAAEKAYRAFLTELNVVLQRGGSAEPTKAMTANAGGPYLKTYAEIAADFREVGARREGSTLIVYARRGGYSPSALNLDVCEDTRKAIAYVGKKRIGSGELLSGYIEMRRVSGRWVAWESDLQKADSCT